MAKNYDFEIYAHPNIYLPTEEAKERKLRIYFSEPDDGVNDDTGLVLFLSGFGGHSGSKVYQKMRQTFADEYNLITVQCDYFGWEFMQAPSNITIPMKDFKQVFSPEEQEYILQGENLLSRLSELCTKRNHIFHVHEKLEETAENFNDMGIMQALDNISAVIAVLEILKDNGCSVNPGKVLAYGHSHGAYLAYLCNAFAPHLFSTIIDNSAWLFPSYLYQFRSFQPYLCLHVTFDYFARRTDFDPELLTLNNLYSKFQNTCRIISFHGTEDLLISLSEKEKFIHSLPSALLYPVSENEVDGKIFQSSKHGLDADFLEMFRLAFTDYIFEPAGENRFTPPPKTNVRFFTTRKSYCFDYSQGLPILTIRDR